MEFMCSIIIEIFTNYSKTSIYNYINSCEVLKFQILINMMCCMVGCILARTISPPSMKLEDNENGRIIDVKASSLVVNDEETKTLLAWLNMINNKASSSPQGKIPNSRGRSIPSSINDNAGDAESYVKKDGFLVAKSPSNVPSLLKKCEGFAFVLVRYKNKNYYETGYFKQYYELRCIISNIIFRKI